MITATDTGLSVWPDCHRDPYKLVAIATHGHEIVVASGFNSTEVRAAQDRISRNPNAIRRIELRDFDGVIDTIWDRSWT